MELSTAVLHNFSNLSKSIVRIYHDIYLIFSYLSVNKCHKNKRFAQSQYKELQKKSSLFKCCRSYKLWEIRSYCITVSTHMLKLDNIAPIYHNDCCSTVCMSTSSRFFPLGY